MASREEKVTAGFFVLVGLVLIIVTVALIAGLRLHRSESVYYVNFTESVYGLDKESTVYYQGVPAGRVKAIDFTPDVSTIRVSLGLDPKLLVKVSMRATMKQHFITNKTIIELLGGKKGDEDLPPLSFIPWQETPFMLVTRSVPDMLAKISDSLEAVRMVLSSDNVARFGHIMENVDLTLAQGRTDIDRISHGVDGLIGEVRQVVGEIGELTRSVRASTDRLEGDLHLALGSAKSTFDQVQAEVTPALRQVTEHVQQATVKFEALLDRAQTLVDPTHEAITRTGSLLADADSLVAENRRGVASALVAMQRASRALEAVLIELERDPGFLLFKRPTDDRNVPAR